MHRFEWPDDPTVEFHLSHGDWIRLLRAHDLDVEDLMELHASAGATTRYDFVTAEWAERWPHEGSGAHVNGEAAAPTVPCTSASQRLQLPHGEEGVEADPLGRGDVRSPTLSVDHTDRVLDHGPFGPEILGGQHDLPPVVTTSSTITRRRPATSPPSQTRSVPYFLGCLRTKYAGRPVTEESIVASGTPPSSKPARPSVPAGTSGTSASTMSRRRAGSDSKRYLSK